MRKLANGISTEFEATGLVFIHCSFFFDPFDLSMSDPIAIGLSICRWRGWRICTTCHPEEPADFMKLFKVCGDEGSHHYEYAILLKQDLIVKCEWRCNLQATDNG